MNKLLLIFDIIPDSVDFYLFGELSSADRVKLLKCHGQFANSVGSDDELMKWLDAFITKNKDSRLDDSRPLIINSGVTIVHSGILL